MPCGTKLEHLDDNLPAADLALTQQDLCEIEGTFPALRAKALRCRLRSMLPSTVNDEPFRKPDAQVSRKR
jgi:hypothetical protein